MGNGQLGVLIWGQDKICLTVNRSDYWDHRCGESYLGPHYKKLVDAYDPFDVGPIINKFIRNERAIKHWNSTRLPCGRFELILTDRIKQHIRVITPWVFEEIPAPVTAALNFLSYELKDTIKIKIAR